MNVNQGVKDMDGETIDLAARLGAEGVAELLTLNDKAGRLALMIREKLALPSAWAFHRAYDGVGEVWLGGEDTCVTVFAPRVIEVIHGVKAEKLNPSSISDPVMTLVSRELERVLAPAPVDRIDEITFALVFEGETFVVEVWRDMDDGDISADIYDRYGVEWVCFCDLGAAPPPM
jgi:hypothetical protein